MLFSANPGNRTVPPRAARVKELFGANQAANARRAPTRTTLHCLTNTRPVPGCRTGGLKNFLQSSRLKAQWQR